MTMYKHLSDLQEAVAQQQLEKDKVKALESLAVSLEAGNWLETSIFGIRSALEDLVTLLTELHEEHSNG